MSRFSKLQRIFQSAISQAAADSGMLLGQELSVTSVTLAEVTSDNFIAGVEDACLVAGVNSLGDYPGTFYLVFSLRDAIVMSGSLLGIPPARIAEKSRLAIMEADDFDAFSEILNQMIGSFKSAVQPLLPKFQLKLLPSRRYVPQEEHEPGDELVPSGAYVILAAGLVMSGKELDRLHLLIPTDLALLMDPQEQAPEPQPQAEIGEPDVEGAEVAAEVPQTPLLLLDDDEEERHKRAGELEAAGYKVFAVTIDSPLDQFYDRGIRLVIVSLDNVDDRALAIGMKLRALSRQAPLPVIMSASQWTRTTVLKALKFGARGIVAKPFAAEDLLAKVERYLKAA